MLVLDRKVGEGFWIEGGIFIKVLGVGRQRVKVGIEAPSNIKIMRDELRSESAGSRPVEPEANGSEGQPQSEGSLRSRRGN